MRPRLPERILTAFYALIAAAACVFLGLNVFLKWINIEDLLNMSKYTLLPCLGVFALWGLFIVYRNLKWTRSRRTGFVGIQNTDNGDVLISVTALHGLASKAASVIDGVTCKAIRVIEHADSVSLRVKMTIKGEHNIPDTTAELQRVIRSHIESYSGIEVKNIKVIITDILPASDKIISAPIVPAESKTPVEEIYYESEPVIRDEQQPEEYAIEETAEEQDNAEGVDNDGNA